MKAGLNGAGRKRQVIPYFIAFSQEQSLSVLRLLVMSHDAAKGVPWCTYLMTVRMKITTPYDTDNYHIARVFDWKIEGRWATGISANNYR